MTDCCLSHSESKTKRDEGVANRDFASENFCLRRDSNSWSSCLGLHGDNSFTGFSWLITKLLVAGPCKASLLSRTALTDKPKLSLFKNVYHNLNVCLLKGLESSSLDEGGSVAYLLPGPAAPGLIPSIPKMISEEIVNVAKVNQWPCSKRKVDSGLKKKQSSTG